MKFQKLSLAAILGAGLLISGTQAFARDRDGDHRGRDRDRYERNWNREQHERREWREHRNYSDRDYRYYSPNYYSPNYYSPNYYSPGYYDYSPNYYQPPPPPAYGPGVSGYFYFGPRR